MKKIAILAALLASIGLAQAQSSVTLFGALDAGTYFANGVQTKSGDAVGVLANTVTSSNWGLKGTEDLGGGTKANFYLESGINVRNGNLSSSTGEATIAGNSATLFDRGSTVGLSGRWGAVDVGNKMNPFFASHAAILPVSGNSVATNASGPLGFADPFVHNSLTYTMPSISGVNAQVQYGFGNNVVSNTAGSALAGTVDYTVGGLNVRAAGQRRFADGTAQSANISSSTGLAQGAKTNYLLGASYKLDKYSVGAGWVSSSLDGFGTVSAYKINAYEVGAGYQATPAVLVGLNWIGTTAGSNLINAQARYAFSKRTQAYAQVGYAVNKGGLNGAGLGNFTALSGSTGSNYGGVVATPTWNQLAVGAGLIHTF